MTFDREELFEHAVRIDDDLHSPFDIHPSPMWFYDPFMRIEAERRHQLTIELCRAIEEEQFGLHFRPIYRLSGRQRRRA